MMLDNVVLGYAIVCYIKLHQVNDVNRIICVKYYLEISEPE